MAAEHMWIWRDSEIPDLVTGEDLLLVLGRKVVIMDDKARVYATLSLAVQSGSIACANFSSRRRILCRTSSVEEEDDGHSGGNRDSGRVPGRAQRRFWPAAAQGQVLA